MSQAPTNSLYKFLENSRAGHIAVTLFDSFPDALFWVKDASGKFIYVNRAFLEYTDKKSEDFIGRDDTEIWPAEYAEIIRRDDQEIMDSKMPLRNKDELLKTSAGSLEWRSTTKMPLFDNVGTCIGTAGFSRKLDYHLDQPIPGLHNTLSKILGHIQEHIHTELTVSDLAKFSNTSVSTMERMFRTHLQTTPKQFIIRAKITASCRMLLDTDMTVSEIAQNLGYVEHASFTRMFTKTMGTSPLSYRTTYKSR